MDKQKDCRNYYVYIHFDESGARYVGKGSKGRAFDFGRRNVKWDQVFGSKKPRVEFYRKNLSEGEAYKVEQDLIFSLRQQGAQLTNILEGHSLFDESKLDQLKKHFSKIRSGKNHWTYGKPRPQETRDKIKATKAAYPERQTRYWKGKKRDPELIRKLVEASHTPEALAKMVESRKDYKPTEKTKRKQSEALSGRKLSSEHSRNISQAKKGRPNGLKGRTLSEEHKQKIAQAHIGKKMPREGVEKRRQKMLGRPSPKRKPVMCVETGEIFACAKLAAEAKGFKEKPIQACCAGSKPTYRGFNWKYV